MNLWTIGWNMTVAGLAMFIIVLVMSLVWHRIDNKADLCLTQAKEFWSKGNKVDGGKWHDETNRLLAIGVRIKAVGVALLYGGGFVTLFGCLLLAVGSRQ